jgi:glycosyltransferase involved in cell wall biosynthesis
MKTEPFVTVLMSVYNGEWYLGEAIGSILNQTFSDFEFLIINDASKDHSREIILSYPDPRIRLIDNEANIGLTRSLNKGLEIARGKYIARMDADDISMPERLNKQVRFMEDNPEIHVLGSWAWVIDENGKITGELKTLTDFDMLFVEVFLSNPIVHSSTLMRTHFVKKIGGYDERFERTQDYDLWVRVIANGGKILNVPKFLLKYRNHLENVSTKKSKQQEDLAQLAIKNAYQLILKQDVNPDTISLIRKCLLQGKNSLSWIEKFQVQTAFRKIVNEFQKRYHLNQPQITYLKNRI